MILNGALKAEQYFTYEKWLEIDGGERTELVDGIIYMMSEPTSQHEAISFELSGQIRNLLVGKTCRGYSGNLGVRLNKGEDTVFGSLIQQKTATAYRLIDGNYVAGVYTDTSKAPVQTLPGCEIDLSLVFRD